MATDLRNLPAFLGDDATFRTWGSGISAQLAAIGLVKTPDTGQIDWATVLRPTVANTYAGYEIWRFADALQATRPVFIKLEYGVGTTATDRPALRIQVASATNGAGTLTGQIGAQAAVYYNGSKTAGSTAPSYCSGNPARLVVVTDFDSTSVVYAKIVVVERARTAAGVDIGDGVLTFFSGSNATQFQVLPFSGAVPFQANVNQAIDPSNGGVSAAGADVALAPTIAAVGGKIGFGSLLIYRNADIGALVPITLDFLGASRIYLPLGAGAARAPVATSTSSGVTIAIPWE